MRRLPAIVARNSRVILLFVLLVVLPAAILAMLIVPAVRIERVRVGYEQAQEQRRIVRLVEADLNDWLFLAKADSAASQALLTFVVEGGSIVFPGFNLALPHVSEPRRRPFTSQPTPGVPLTAEIVTEQYYPRIQAFLRDLRAGQHSGAQYFLRLRALVVRRPNSSDGYVLESERVLRYVNARLAEYCEAEAFSGELRIRDEPPLRRDGETRSAAAPVAAEAIGLTDFPFFQVGFEPRPERARLFGDVVLPYSLLLLMAVAVMGSVFVYRVVAREVQLSQLRNDFVAAVSHEFRSPLSSILALAERLEAVRTRQPEKLSEYHHIIRRDAQRLETLVSRLLDFAQIENGRRVFARERIDLTAVARAAADATHHAVRSERIAFDDQAPVWVEADADAMRQCIQNLIENAGKYSPADSPIAIACSRANGTASVAVTDRGVGIPASEQRKIFDKFYRGPQSSGDVQGVGIGLALVKQIVEAHGGSVTVESEPGRGSRFEIRLPSAD